MERSHRSISFVQVECAITQFFGSKHEQVECGRLVQSVPLKRNGSSGASVS